MQLFSRLSKNNKLSEIEVLPENGIYVFLFSGKWKTTTTNAIDDNFNVFSGAINPNTVHRITENDIGADFWEMVDINNDVLPALLVTTLHPSTWETQGAVERFAVIRLGLLSDYDSTSEYLQKLAQILSKKNQNSEIHWAARVELMKRISRKVPILDLLGLGMG